MNSVKKRNLTRRSNKRNCAKKIKERDKAKLKFELERVKECDQEDCDTFLKCTEKVTPVNIVNSKTLTKKFERWKKEAKKLCGSGIACTKYYACSRKVAKRTGYDTGVENVMKCSDNLLA